MNTPAVALIPESIAPSPRCAACDKELEHRPTDRSRRIAAVDEDGDYWCSRCAWSLDHAGESLAYGGRRVA